MTRYLSSHKETAEQRPEQAPAASRSSPPRTVALIPAYNEERFIGSLVLAARSYVDQVIVVNDGSHDRTSEIARAAGALVIDHPTNLGKSAAVNTGFAYLRAIRPVAAVMLDGDGQHCADDIPAVLQPVINGHADIAVGSRFREVKSDIPVYRQVGQHSLTLATNLTSGVWISDSQSGFRAFSARAIDHLKFSCGGFSIESEMQFLIRDHGLRVLEVPIKVLYAEPAKRNPFTHGMQVLNGILRLVGQTRPLLFFGVGGLAILLASGLLGLHIIDIYGRTHDLAVGYGLLTVLLGVTGVVLLFSGLILHSTRGMFVALRSALNEQRASPLPTTIHQPELPQEELAIEVGR
ncbi:MAG: glycosyltransferase family 2 protein [Chloroflexota bacterium]